MRHQIYTVIFMGINRTSNVQTRIVVDCDEFMRAHKHLPLFGIFNYVHCSLSCGGGQKPCTTVPQAKMVIGDIHHRGKRFGGAHVWKMNHPQAMEFFHTKKLGSMGGAQTSYIISVKLLYCPSLMCKKVCASSKCTHTSFPLHGYQLQL